MKIGRFFTFLLAVGLLVSGSAVFAKLSLPSVIGDNMVLQRTSEVPVWGWAQPGEKVEVHMEGQQASTVADDKGAWKTHLDLSKVEGEGPFSMTISASGSIELKNILLGEVWLCSGQSNMYFPVKAADNAEGEIAAANYPRMRLYTAAPVVASGPQKNVGGRWVECTPESIPDFSAVAYYFGRALHRQLNVPIGLVESDWGGTPSEAWTSPEKVAQVPEFEPIVRRWKEAVAGVPKLFKDYRERLDKWEKKANRFEAAGNPVPEAPKPPQDPRRSPHRYSVLYNGMIHPLIPYAIRGAIWYQGESNAGRAYQYRTIFPAMIDSWREAWGEGDFPFYWVQLANFYAVKDQLDESAWAELREAQTMTLSLPNTGQAVIIDIGEAKNIHPTNKQDVGWRLALNALAKTYGRNIIYSSPMYKSMKVQGNKVSLVFDHVGSGLQVKGDGPVKGFAVAGEDKKFSWAEAKITAPDTVTVHSEAVPKPVAVRYAWADNPVCNLYNNAGLPACPFRTDDWPGITINEK